MPDKREDNAPNPEPEPATDATEESARLVFAFPVAVRATGAGDRESLLSLAKAAAQDPSIFEEEGRQPYFWAAEISSSVLDSYMTHMLPTTLRNFAEDATAGVAFMNSHRTGGWFSSGELPLGRSLRGKFVGGGGNGVARTLADFYTIPGLQLGEVSTDQAIAAIRSGIGSDVSVGFHLGSEGRYLCDLCGNDYLSQDCPHYLGMSYESEESRARKKTTKKCTAGIDNARLSEVSLVYDGATPGAAILKATRAMEAGTLTPELARMLETQYRCRLPAARHAWAGFTAPGMVTINNTLPATATGAPPLWITGSGYGGTDSVDAVSAGRIIARDGALWWQAGPQEPEQRILIGTTGSLDASAAGTLPLTPDSTRDAAPEGAADDSNGGGDAATDTLRKETPMPENTAAGGATAAPESAPELEALRTQLTEAQSRAQTAEAELAALKESLGDTPVTELRQQAADGREYREDLLKALGTEYVRDVGAKGDPEDIIAGYRTATLERIKTVTERFRESADAKLPERRVTVDVDPAETDEEGQRNGHRREGVPAEAFKTRG